MSAVLYRSTVRVLPLALCCLILASPARSLAAEPDPFDAVLALEGEGKLDVALRRLRASEELRAAHKEHEAALAGLLRSLDSVRARLASRQTTQAQTALQALLPKLDPLRDAHLLHAAHRKLAELEAAARATVEADLDQADALARRGEQGEAIAIYTDIAESKQPEVPPELKRRARRGKARSEQAKTEAEALGFWGKTWHSMTGGVETLAGWSVYLVAGALVVWGAGRWRRRRSARDETLIVLEDLTVQASERDVMSQGLIREVLLRFRSLGNGEDRVADIDSLDDLDGSALASLRVEAEPLTDIESVIQDGTPVQVGPFAVTPRQLVALVRAYFRRPWRAELVGSLIQQGEQTVLLIERRRIGQGAEAPSTDRWEARASGANGRAAVVHKMAARLAFELAKTKLTSDWRSFESFREAMGHLVRSEEAGDREKNLEAACRDLQRALRHDPSNWIARFHLATTQRKLGHNESAVKHFEFLERMAVDGTNGLGPMVGFLATHPELLYTIRYSKAVALSKIPDWGPHREALRILDALVDLVTVLPAGGLMEPQRIRLEMLARSARAAALTFELESARRGMDSARAQQRQQQFQAQVLLRIDVERRWIKDLPLSQLDWKAYSLSYAVVHNAYGRACYLLGRDGTEALREALTMSPDFAEAYITLAESYMRARRHNLGWSKQAEELLKQALTVNPSNQKTHYLLGKLYADPAVANYGKAKEHLGKAELFPWSYFQLAQILEKQDGKIEEALRQVRRSISLAPYPDERFAAFVRYALRVLASQDKPNADLLAEAESVASRLVKNGETAGNRRTGGRLLEEIQAFRKPVRGRRTGGPKPADPAPPDPGAVETATGDNELPCLPSPEVLLAPPPGSPGGPPPTV